MAAPAAADVAAFLGQAGDSAVVSLAGQHLPIITAWVKSYTRGVGFTYDVPDDPISAVIVAATARLTQNPEGKITVALDDYSVRMTVFEGFSLVERMVLDGYRRKAA
ncbi:hypothetical protein [Leucobacter tenebrionis]|uniref:hypothetical protein n=1 Tax=Leucobacter tenebrionis TaxID=2873270 RepID=UPI001CA60DF4|nr:hypothetical protein [Leucobacter tenebrionis]QZY52722.1 hypothetical protein KVY00_04545 [Leucobacter tenebrionis]